MSLEERLKKLLEPSERVLAVGAEELVTNSVRKSSSTSANGRTTRSRWTEHTKGRIPIVFTDRRMLRIGDASSAGHKVGSTVWRIHQDMEHGVPLGDLREFDVRPLKHGGVSVEAVPYVGRPVRITVFDTSEEGVRLKALGALAKRWKEGGFPIEASRREALATRGEEVSAHRKALSQAIVRGRSMGGSIVSLVVGVLASGPGLVMGAIALWGAFETLQDVLSGHAWRDSAMLLLVLGLGTILLLGVGSLLAVMGLRGVRTAYRARQDVGRLTEQVAELLDHSTV